MLPSAGDLKFVFYPLWRGRFLFLGIAILKALLFYLVNYFHRFKILINLPLGNNSILSISLVDL